MNATQLDLFNAPPPGSTHFWRTRFWDDNVRPFCRWTGSGHGERNTLSVLVPDAGTSAEVRAWLATCVACGAAMHPVRERLKRHPSDRRTEKATLYVAVACGEPGCSRGRAATEAFDQLHEMIR